MVTENSADAVITPPAASPPFTKEPAALTIPEPEALLAISSLLDQEGGALVSTGDLLPVIRATQRVIV